MSFKGHQIHDLQVRHPELRQDVDIDGRHAELVLPPTPLQPQPPCVVPEHGGLQSGVLLPGSDIIAGNQNFFFFFK